jgi:hypothetical protein
MKLNPDLIHLGVGVLQNGWFTMEKTIENG